MGSFGSLSPSSEVSDIRRWFPSYVYESFVLDTGDGFGDSVFKEDETEEDGRIAEGLRNGENFGGFTTTINLDDEKTSPNDENNNSLQPSAKMPDSVHSPSQLSDPPSIKKLFSNYEYESPVLGLSDDGLSDTDSKENKCDKEQGVVENNREKEEGRLEHGDITNSKHDVGAGKCECDGFLGASKLEKQVISDSLLSSSLISADPPDVRNWFPNYTYESPILDTVDGNEDSITSECVNEKFVIEDRIEDKKVNLRTFQQNKFYVPKKTKPLICNSSFGDFKEENKLLCEKQNLPPDASFQSLKVDTSSRNMERKSPRKEICRKDFGESSFSKEQAWFASTTTMSNSKLAKVDVDSMTTTWGRNDKEFEGKHNSENGFVTMRKNKPNDENSRPEEILLGGSRNKSRVPLHQTKRINSAELDIASNSVEGRNILAERSNFQHPDVMGVTGKWRCPQKNKPNIGPPMKQLRLERWVNRH
ncbi:uncharacterized protein LOC120017140 isoform X1 [Tripterygium wilfordii]|uniref:uncharacterized protein LOC120017140 isoform X1 n=1 Tax=Tripterygium wilfordii TaxID=458696 RepID=UPI0018F86028|nr:uncharacterized protein LOC120017140 isoform X1 [Tripterygium wilfordii]